MHPDPRRSALLGDERLRRGLARSLAKRVPPAEVDDLVQATLLDALAAEAAPYDGVELEKWVYGILRNKVSDHYRGRRREAPLDPDGLHTLAGGSDASARELLGWAEKELPPGEHSARTLGWMLAEGDGEKLESIARAERVPAPTIRQRVARLRRHFRERWAAQVAAIVSLVALAAALAVLAWHHFRASHIELAITKEPPVLPERRAEALRRSGLELCERREFAPCLRDLDDAKRLDPTGDLAAPVQAARAAASAPSPAPTVVPLPSVPQATERTLPPMPSALPPRRAPKTTGTSTLPPIPPPPASSPRPPRTTGASSL